MYPSLYYITLAITSLFSLLSLYIHIYIYLSIYLYIVGYGDYYPSTHPGRFIGVLACLWGVFLVSMFVVTLSVSVECSRNEGKVYTASIQDIHTHRFLYVHMSVIFLILLYQYIQTYSSSNISLILCHIIRPLSC